MASQLKLSDTIPMLSSIENISIIGLNNTINKANNCINTNNQENTLVIYNTKVPKAILHCHPSSHSFLDRTIILDKAVRIGRSAGHAKAASNNGIFDCRVLSRNHALIWFTDNKFFLKDTKSSNGTFVNRERLSRSLEESVPLEIFSGDTVQFGVDVVESSHNVTHGCIIATVKLFLPDGSEAKPKPTPPAPVTEKGKIILEDLYHLNEYIQEALHREQMLENKLSSLRQLVQTLQESTELSWKALISNNSLLSRVELLEVQLQCYSKKFAEDKLREELRLLQEDKNNYQGAVKEFFQKIVDEKLKAVQRGQDLARALANSRTECSNTKELLTTCQNELRGLAQKNTLQEKTIEGLELKLLAAEENNKEMQQQLSDMKDILQLQIKNHSDREEALQQTMKDLEIHANYSNKQVFSLQCQVEELQKYHNEILCELIDPEVIKEKGNNNDLIKSWISIYTEARKKSDRSAIAIRNKVNDLRNEKITKQQSISAFECELDKCAIELQNSKDEEMELEQKIRSLEKELAILKPTPDIIECSLDELSSVKQFDETDLLLIELQDKKKFLSVLRKKIKILEDKCHDLEKKLQILRDRVMELTVCYMIEEDKLAMSEKQNLTLELALKSLSEHLDNLNAYREDMIPVEEVDSLKMQLSEAHEVSQERQKIILRLAKYCSEFTQTVDQKLDTLESSVCEFMEYTRDINIFDDTLRSLKEDSEILTCAINELQTIVADSLSQVAVIRAISGSERMRGNSKSEEVTVGEDVTDNIEPLLASSSGHYEVSCRGPDDAVKYKRVALNDDLVIVKEKYKLILNEKLHAEEQLVKLREEFLYVTSYPNFDICFVLPIVVLIAVCFFKYWNIFPFLF